MRPTGGESTLLIFGIYCGSVFQLLVGSKIRGLVLAVQPADVFMRRHRKMLPHQLLLQKRIVLAVTLSIGDHV